VAQHVSDVFAPIIRSLQLPKQPLVLPLERGGSSVVDRGLAGCEESGWVNSQDFTSLLLDV